MIGVNVVLDQVKISESIHTQSVSDPKYFSNTRPKVKQPYPSDPDFNRRISSGTALRRSWLDINIFTSLIRSFHWVGGGRHYHSCQQYHDKALLDFPTWLGYRTNDQTTFSSMLENFTCRYCVLNALFSIKLDQDPMKRQHLDCSWLCPKSLVGRIKLGQTYILWLLHQHL